MTFQHAAERVREKVCQGAKDKASQASAEQARALAWFDAMVKDVAQSQSQTQNEEV